MLFYALVLCHLAQAAFWLRLAGHHSRVGSPLPDHSFGGESTESQRISPETHFARREAIDALERAEQRRYDAVMAEPGCDRCRRVRRK
jgi:hypothetical protein